MRRCNTVGNLFNIENGFFSTIGKAVDILFISVIYLLCCIPIVTIGPATTALYYVVVKVIRRERGYLIREFFRSFKLNFKKGLIIGLIFTVMFAIIIVDIIWSSVVATGESKWDTAMIGVFIAIGVVMYCINVYIFPLLSRFDMTVKQLFKASVFMSFKHLPSTITMVVLSAAAFVAPILVQPILMFVLPGLSMLLISFPMERILKKYMPEKEESEETEKSEESEESEEYSAKDEWYLE